MLSRTQNQSSSCRGMSLVELVVVMAILSVVMLAVMSLYVPAHQSTVAQTQVSDIQANLRLAMTRMSQDLIMAGFLITGDPIIFDPSAPADNQDFTIRTRLIGDGFGRITAAVVAAPPAPADNVDLTLSRVDMVDHFRVNTKVRIFNPVSTRECGTPYDESIASDAKDRVYTVEFVDRASRLVRLDTDGIIGAGDIFAESVLVRILNDDQPPMQTIRYRLDGGVLERIVNGNPQLLAHNLSNANFAYTTTAAGRVRKVDISLTGQTKALKNDAISGAKIRQLQTTVVLRNIF